MTDPFRIARRGAEQFAPRSRWEPLAADSHRVLRATSYLVASERAEKSAGMLDDKPPYPRFEVERRAMIANLLTDDGSSRRSRRAVEHRSQVGDGIRISQRLTRVLLLELSAQRRGATSHTITCLTSARGGRDSAHVRFVVSSVRRCAPVTLQQPSRVTRELVAGALEDSVQ
jgi:hypothetical protein